MEKYHTVEKNQEERQYTEEILHFFIIEERKQLHKKLMAELLQKYSMPYFYRFANRFKFPRGVEFVDDSDF